MSDHSAQSPKSDEGTENCDSNPKHEKNEASGRNDPDDSDDEQPIAFKKKIVDLKGIVNAQKKDFDENNSDDEILSGRKIIKGAKRLIIESDDESIGDSESNQVLQDVNSSTQRKPLDDSSDEDELPPAIKSPVQQSSSSSDEGNSEDECSIDAIKSKVVERLHQHELDAPKEKKKSTSRKEKAPSRKAKEAALAEIHSETQRMIRERKISLPYHQPKQRTLADFLNRRKLAPTASLKTSSDELAKVLKHVEEREKAAEVFYGVENDADIEPGNDLTTTAIELNEAEKNSNISTTSAAALNSSEVCQPSTWNSLLEESDEFPRLQLSEVLTNSENPETADSVDAVEGNTRPNTDTCKYHDAPAVQGAEVTENLEVTELTTTNGTENTLNKVDSAPLQSSEEIVHSSMGEETYSSFNLSEKLNSLNLPIAKFPKITGDPDEEIDLDELSTKPGAFGLMQRFLKHAKLKPKVKHQDTVMSVITSEVNDCQEVIHINKETIKVSAKKEEPKPGETFVVLKTTLQQKIAVNRERQLAKKLEEYKLYEEEFYGALRSDDVDEVDELLSEDECDAKTGKRNIKEHCSSNPLISEEAEEDEDIEDEEADEGEEAEEDNVEDDERNSDEDVESVVGSERNSDGESEEDDDSEDESKIKDDENSIPPSIPKAFKTLSGNQDVEAMDESQLVALCSGHFGSTLVDLNKLESASEAFENGDDSSSLFIHDKENKSDESDDEESIEGGEKSADEDDGKESDEELIPKKAHSRMRKLSFSDDEDGTAEQNEGEDVDVESEKDDREEPIVDEFGDDDDDEEIQLAKKLTKGFLEREAELSESEWGSDDEDEKGMDEYEREEGDEERINQRRLQKELGKIHAREMMVEDSREIKILQELLLEDGELHSDGPKRQRLFRWNNQGGEDYPEKRPFGVETEENGLVDDEDDEDSWRKERLERENYLRKKKIDHLEGDDLDCSVNFNTSKNSKITPKIQPPPSNASPDPKSSFGIFAKRGSFLNRGEKMLSKLAEITNYAGGKEKALTSSRNNRNMVFSVISPEKEKAEEEVVEKVQVKRKMDFATTNAPKRIKSDKCNTSHKLSVLEQLKVLEST